MTTRIAVTAKHVNKRYSESSAHAAQPVKAHIKKRLLDSDFLYELDLANIEQTHISLIFNFKK